MMTPCLWRTPVSSSALRRGLAVIERRCVVGCRRAECGISSVEGLCCECADVHARECVPLHISNVETQTHNSAQVF